MGDSEPVSEEEKVGVVASLAFLGVRPPEEVRRTASGLTILVFSSEITPGEVEQVTAYVLGRGRA